MTWQIHNPQPRDSLRNHMPPQLTLDAIVEVILVGGDALRYVQAGDLHWWDCGSGSIVLWRVR